MNDCHTCKHLSKSPWESVCVNCNGFHNWVQKTGGEQVSKIKLSKYWIVKGCTQSEGYLCPDVDPLLDELERLRELESEFKECIRKAEIAMEKEESKTVEWKRYEDEMPEENKAIFVWDSVDKITHYYRYQVLDHNWHPDITHWCYAIVPDAPVDHIGKANKKVIEKLEFSKLSQQSMVTIMRLVIEKQSEIIDALDERNEK
jgi:hypothetical protein